MSAIEELKKMLNDGERIESIVFGDYGWSGYNEPEPPAIPVDLRGKPMEIDEAAKYMKTWSFYGGYGAPECYAVYIWTTERVMWVTQYDGATGLNFAPRNPSDTMPEMPGG